MPSALGKVAGELAKAGENVSAPLGALCLLSEGPVTGLTNIEHPTSASNKIEPLGHEEAIATFNILFFAHDREIVKLEFQSACEFVERVPISRLAFTPSTPGPGNDNMTASTSPAVPPSSPTGWGDSMTIMSAEGSTLSTPSETAAAIWQAAGGQTPLVQYRRREGSEFDVDPGQALQERAQLRRGACFSSHSPALRQAPTLQSTPAAARAVRGWIPLAGRLPHFVPRSVYWCRHGIWIKNRAL